MSDVTTTLRLNDQASSVLRSVANTAKQTQSQMQQTGKAIDQAFRSSSPQTFATAAGNAMNKVSSSAENLGNKIDDIFDDIDTGFAEEIDSGFRSAAQGADEFREAADEAGEALMDAASSAEELGENIDGIGGGGSGLDSVAGDAGKAGTAMQDASGKALDLGKALKTMAAAIGVAAIANEVKQFVGDSIELGKTYSSTMSEVAAISGATGAEYEMLEQTAREYGATTIFSASEAAEALKYMSLAGWDAQQSASALGGVLNLAAASGMELGQASDMVTDYLSAFGMSADQAGYFADLLAYAQANSNTSAEQLGQAYLNSAASLNAAGQDIETTTSLIEAMANQGTKGARAGTQLAAIMRDITNSMEKGAIKIGDTSVAVQDQYGNFRDLTDILYDVEAAVDGMGSAERSAALAATFTADSTKGVNQILTEGMENIAGYEEALRGSAGAAGTAAEIMTDNLEGDMAQMNSAWEEMQLQVYEGLEGTLRDGAQYVTSTVIPILTEWVPEALSVIGDTIGKVGNALKPLFETLLKNPKAVSTALVGIGSGLLVFKTMTALPGIISGIATHLSSLGAVIMANPWAAGAAALAASVILIKGAVDEYNALQIENSLEARFGDIDLSDADIKELASKIIDVEWVANINVALGEFENAEEFHEEAEEHMQNIEKLTWLASVETTLIQATGENGEFLDYVSPLITAIQGTLDEKREDTGLKFRPFALIELNPGTETDEYGNESIVQKLIDFANAAIDGDTTELNTYARDVAISLGANLGTEEGQSLVGDLINAANAAITGDETELETYAREILIDLGQDPEQFADGGASVLGNLINVINSAITGDETELATYSRLVAIALNADFGENGEGNAALVADMVATVNAAITGDDTALETYARNVAVDLGVDTSTEEGGSIIDSIIAVANAAITGDHEALSEFTDDVVVNLTPSEGGRFMRALATLAEGLATTDLVDENGEPIVYSKPMGVYLNPTMQEDYKQEWQNWLDSKQSEFESLTSAAALSIGTVMGDTAGQAMLDQMKTWAAEDTQELNDLSDSLTELIQNSLEDGVLSVEEQTAIDMLQQKISNIISGWKQSQADAEWELLETKWSGKDLTSGSFVALLDEMHNQRQSALEALDADTVEMYSVFNGWASSGKITDAQNEDLHSLWNQNYLNMEAESLARGVSFATNTLSDTYGDVVSKNLETLDEGAGEAIRLWSQYAAQTGIDDAYDASIRESLQSLDPITLLGGVSGGADLGALKELYKSMEPDVATMQSLMDRYQESGTQIPQALTDAFYAAIDIGAASGDESAAWQKYANAIVASGDTALIEAFADADGVFATAVPELKEALDRALYAAENSADSASLSDFFSQMLGLEDGEIQIDMSKVSALLESVGVDVAAYFSENELEAAGNVDTTLEETNNVPEVYDSVDTAVQTAFEDNFAASADVDVTLTANYTLANPVTNLSFTGAATGSSVVQAYLHAMGGYFSNAHLGIVAEDGPEYIIPMDGSNESLEMWADAGKMLGAFDGPISTLPEGADSSSNSGSVSGSRDINLNINGSGMLAVQTNGSMSKEEIVDILIDNMKDVLMAIVEQEIITEGEGVYEY